MHQLFYEERIILLGKIEMGMEVNEEEETKMGKEAGNGLLQWWIFLFHICSKLNAEPVKITTRNLNVTEIVITFIYH